MEKNTKKIKILIIEDLRDCLQFIERKIKYSNEDKRDICEIINPGPIETVGHALKIIRDNKESDMILLDMNFGDKVVHGKFSDGYRVAERLTADERKKIICTSGEPEAYEEILRELGIRHFGGKGNFMPCIFEECHCNK